MEKVSKFIYKFIAFFLGSIGAQKTTDQWLDCTLQLFISQTYINLITHFIFWLFVLFPISNQENSTNEFLYPFVM